MYLRTLSAVLRSKQSPVSLKASKPSTRSRISSTSVAVVVQVVIFVVIVVLVVVVAVAAVAVVVVVAVAAVAVVEVEVVVAEVEIVYVLSIIALIASYRYHSSYIHTVPTCIQDGSPQIHIVGGGVSTASEEIYTAFIIIIRMTLRI